MHTQHKRHYHPLIIVLYKSNMLSKQQIDNIPRSTLNYWKNMDLSDLFGCDWANEYVRQFEDIKTVFSKKYRFRAVRFMCKMSDSYDEILQNISSKKKLLKKHADLFLNQVDEIVKQTNYTKANVCSLLGISHQWYNRQKSKIKCKISPINKCYRQIPNQLTVDEVKQIEEIVLKPENQRYNLTTLYYRSMKSSLIAFSKSTFGKYAKIYRTFRKPRFKAKSKDGFRASKAFEWLHVDVTYVPTLNSGVQKLAFVKDNFSKAILHYKTTSCKADSIFIRDLFQETFEKYDLFNATNPINILSDGGSENKGAFLTWIQNIQAPPVVVKITAKTDEFPYSNSMSESTHSIFKSEFLQKQTCFNQESYLKSVEEFIEYYNNERYPGDHHGLTALEVLNGEIPTKNRFSEQIKEGRKIRLEANKKFKCKVEIPNFTSSKTCVGK